MQKIISQRERERERESKNPNHAVNPQVKNSLDNIESLDQKIRAFLFVDSGLEDNTRVFNVVALSL